MSESFVYAAAHLRRGQLLDFLLEIEDRLRALIRAALSRERSDSRLSGVVVVSKST
jgi:hypothetical protein